MPQIIVTFDLQDAAPEEYASAYEALAVFGLTRETAQKGVPLPETTVMGTTDLAPTVKELRNRLRAIIVEASGCEVKRILVGIVGAWAAA
jgi:hypothetical protein